MFPGTPTTGLCANIQLNHPVKCATKLFVNHADFTAVEDQLTLWGGTSKDLVLRSTLENLSMHGRMKKMPGPKRKESPVTHPQLLEQISKVPGLAGM